MSVPKDRRMEGELTVNTMARSTCAYVIQILGNEKNFPVEQMWFTNQLRNTAVHIDLCCWKANNIYVKQSQFLYEKRMKLEEEAGDACNVMLELINIAKQVYHMPTKRYHYLSNQYVELRNKIRNWYKSDKVRLLPTV